MNNLYELEQLLIQGEELKKSERKKYQKEYYENNKCRIKKYRKVYQKEYKEKNKDKLKEYQEKYQKEYHENKARELGFENRAQKQRYDRWRKKNNSSTSTKDSDYLNNIEYWIENVDK